MTIKEKASATWDDLKQKLQDKENQRRVREEIERRLKQGKEAIDRLEKELRNPENRAKMKIKLKETKIKLKKAKAEFDKKKGEAIAFAKHNPEKALVIAAAAGVFAGTLWGAFRRKR